MKNIVVFLGSRCNANCSYCHADKNTSGGFDDPSDVFYQYLTREFDAPASELKLLFLGGEPTLYMDSIGKIVSHCAGRKVSYMLTTNGLRLNDPATVRFLNDHNFYVSVSFDGKRGVRGYDDVFYNPAYRQSLRDLKHLGCSTTFSRHNADFLGAAAEIGRIENQLGRMLPFRPHAVHATHPGLKPLALDRSQAEDYARTYIRLAERFVAGYRHGLSYSNLYPLFAHLYRQLGNEYRFPETRCFNRRHVQADLAGNCYLCTYERSGDNYLGTLADEAPAWERLADIVRERRPGCPGCEFYRYCGTYCLASVDHATECLIQKRLLDWLLNLLAKEQLDFAALAGQEFSKRTGGFYELYR